MIIMYTNICNTVHCGHPPFKGTVALTTCSMAAATVSFVVNVML
jgi:hypothetical protein